MPSLFTNTPDALLRLWNKFALHRGLDANNPPATIEEAYRQVIALQLGHVAYLLEDIYRDANALVAEEGLLDANAQQAGAVCARCGAGDLEHFYTSKRRGTMLCEACFQRQVEGGQAREAAAQSEKGD